MFKIIKISICATALLLAFLLGAKFAGPIGNITSDSNELQKEKIVIPGVDFKEDASEDDSSISIEKNLEVVPDETMDTENQAIDETVGIEELQTQDEIITEEETVGTPEAQDEMMEGDITTEESAITEEEIITETPVVQGDIEIDTIINEEIPSEISEEAISPEEIQEIDSEDIMTEEISPLEMESTIQEINQ